MDDLNRTTNRLRRKFDPTSNCLETKAQMEQVMDSARWVNQVMTKGNHIWWGVTVENKKHGLPRLDCRQKCGVTMLFLSCEPLLENLGRVSLDGIDWVIVGGESGPGAPFGEPQVV